MDKLAPNTIRATREAARLSQAEAAALVGATRRTWQNWEAPEGSANNRTMPAGTWAQFEPLARRAVVEFERCTSRAAILETAAQISAELDL
jgi:DNA-binding XRE family transcriptional regulator